MRSIILILFIFISCAVEAQFSLRLKHKKSVPNVSPLAGTWKCIGSARLKNDKVDTSFTAYLMEYKWCNYFWFDSHLHNVEEYRIFSDSIEQFYFENLQDANLTWNNDIVDTVKPTNMELRGAWCDYEGWGEHDSIVYVNDTLIDIISSWADYDSTIETAICHYRKIDAPKSVSISDLSNYFGNWHCYWTQLQTYGSLSTMNNDTAYLNFDSALFEIRSTRHYLNSDWVHEIVFKDSYSDGYSVMMYDGHLVLVSGNLYAMFTYRSEKEMICSVYAQCGVNAPQGVFHFYRDDPK